MLDVPIDASVDTVSSDFVTVTWTVYVTVSQVSVQHRVATSPQARVLITADGWTEEPPVPADRGLYNIEGLEPGVTYDYRLKLINDSQEQFGETNQVTLCPEGFQGANCEISKCDIRVVWNSAYLFCFCIICQLPVQAYPICLCCNGNQFFL